MSISNTGSVDLESVLNVRRRTLTSIGEFGIDPPQKLNIETIYVKRQDRSDSIFHVDSKLMVFGDLQLLCAIFERFTSNLLVFEEKTAQALNTDIIQSVGKSPFEPTEEETEQDDDGPPLVSMVQRTSINSPKGSGSSSPLSSSPTNQMNHLFRRKVLNSIGRSQTLPDRPSDFQSQNLEGKRYGGIEMPSMTLIEVLEILFRVGLELVDVFSDYDEKEILHQNFIFSKTRQLSVRYGTTYFKSN